MAEYTVKAGAKFETITKKELQDAMGAHLRDWVAQLAVGGRFTRFVASATVTAGVITVTGDALAPEPGFVWDVRRLHITGLAANDVASVYINEAAPSQIVGSTTDLPLAANRSFLWSGQCVLYPGDTLFVYGAGITATGTITVSGQVLELPVGLAWKLT